MEGLPFLPGNTYTDPSKSRFHVSQTLGYKNGYRIPAPYPSVGIGGEPLPVNQLAQSELDELANFNPTLTYGKAKQEPPKNFVPAHVAFDKKVLRFFGYFKETVNESPKEHYRVRHINIYYYLEDDSICITEPPKENSGIPQGTLLRRQRIPKNDVGDHYSWKDINLGTNLCVYGRVYRVTSCDAFTKTFLESEGIEVNSPEERPDDPYLSKRNAGAALKTFKTASSFDSRRQFLEMDRKVLRFYAVWDDRDKMFGEARYFFVHYYLVDDTMEVREIHQPNDGRDPFPVLIRRDKIPRNRYDVAPTFPSISLELSSNEIKDYYSPQHLKVGETVNILGRPFLLYDCDNFTKAWYYQHFGVTDFTPIDVGARKRHDEDDPAKMEIGPYTGYGSLEDSMASALSVQPKAPKLDFVKQVDNGTQTLRYEAILDSIRPEDNGRRFILSYRLADDMINIYEPPIRNSGIAGGTFLSRARIAKPGSTSDRPEYYGPSDLYIGAKIEVFGNRFIITNADLFVLKFLESRLDQVPAVVVESIRQRLSQDDAIHQSKNVKGRPVELRRHDGDIVRLMHEIRSQLKKMAITDRSRVDEMFLRYNKDRQGSIGVANIQDMCRKMQLPDYEDVISALMNESGADGKMNLEQFRKFIEN